MQAKTSVTRMVVLPVHSLVFFIYFGSLSEPSLANSHQFLSWVALFLDSAGSIAAANGSSWTLAVVFVEEAFVPVL